jgi:hypothetical protein
MAVAEWQDWCTSNKSVMISEGADSIFESAPFYIGVKGDWFGFFIQFISKAPHCPARRRE